MRYFINFLLYILYIYNISLQILPSFLMLIFYFYVNYLMNLLNFLLHLPADASKYHFQLKLFTYFLFFNFLGERRGNCVFDACFVWPNRFFDICLKL